MGSEMCIRDSFPESWDFYGKLKVTKIAEQSVESFFLQRNIDYNNYFEDDNEHFNQLYHKLIAQKFLKHLTKT